jgi:hypothetical protein
MEQLSGTAVVNTEPEYGSKGKRSPFVVKDVLDHEVAIRTSCARSMTKKAGRPKAPKQLEPN